MSKLAKYLSAIIVSFMFIVMFKMLGIDIFSFVAGIIVAVMYWIVVSSDL